VSASWHRWGENRQTAFSRRRFHSIWPKRELGEVEAGHRLDREDKKVIGFFSQGLILPAAREEKGDVKEPGGVLGGGGLWKMLKVKGGCFFGGGVCGWGFGGFWGGLGVGGGSVVCVGGGWSNLGGGFAARERRGKKKSDMNPLLAEEGEKKRASEVKMTALRSRHKEKKQKSGFPLGKEKETIFYLSAEDKRRGRSRESETRCREKSCRGWTPRRKEECAKEYEWRR